MHIIGGAERLSMLAEGLAPTALDVAFINDATFTVSVGGTTWLESAPIRLFADGAWQRLERTAVRNSTGEDVLGSYTCVNVSWSWPWSQKGGVLHTALRTYDGLGVAVFVQQCRSEPTTRTPRTRRCRAASVRSSQATIRPW